MSTSVPKALLGKLDIKRHSPNILYLANSLNPDEMLKVNMIKIVEEYRT